ncbi:hypothetical protein [Sphingorhabdus sp.]
MLHRAVSVRLLQILGEPVTYPRERQLLTRHALGLSLTHPLV